ncbi:MAG: PatB family C-S lyase [Candidatus Fermentibacteraceae bacterium]|nr:PatB family C-S lyase [Candidatus Fermentibacteraceae bacterium]MBN2608383.1 PatB family C-S lyase [Candidatus Fermentibacteraceae bacterium]
MDYEFDRVIDRRSTDSFKWNMNRQVFGTADVLPMWVADMDFRVPEQVIEALVRRASHGLFGYPCKPDTFYEAVMSWFERHYGWTIRKEWIVATPGVVPALCTAMTAFTAPGDGIVFQPPVYYLFEQSVRNNGRRALENRLRCCEDEYSFDMDDLQEKAGEAKMLILCSPHNPVGRVWTKGELKNILKVCSENEIFLFSDEIHADLVFPGQRHIPAGLPGTLKENLICAYSASKTFNLAGLGLSINVIPGKRTREKFQQALQASALWLSNIFGMVGTEAAYRHGDEWLAKLMVYMEDNYRLVRNELARKVPEIRVPRPQATYLLWMDCRGMGMTDEELEDFFVKKAKLGLDTGKMFGPGGEGFMRMNIACPRSTVQKALDSLATAWDQRGRT